MVDIKKLKAAIVEKGLTIEDVAAATEMSQSTLYRRLSSGGGSFTLRDVAKISAFLGLSSTRMNEIFFAEEVA